VTQQTIGIGVVGMGFMGRAFAQICNQLLDVTLVGVTDTLETVGRDAAKRFSTTYYADPTSLIKSPDVQALIIATPEDAHLASCLEALALNKSVLVEKPIADTTANAEKILAAASQSTGVLMVGHVLRFATSYATIKQIVDEGRVGKVQYIQTRRLNGKAAQDRLKGRCSLPVFLGVHDYDVARWIAGSEPVRVYAESQFGVLQQSGYDIEDSNWTMITFSNGVLAVCETGWILPNGHPAGADQVLVVQGSEGRVELELVKQNILLSSEEGASYPDISFMPTINGELRGGFVHEVQHFIGAIQADTEPLVTGHDGMVALQIAEASIASASSHMPVLWK
jgi:predicted dehydrogenase